MRRALRRLGGDLGVTSSAQLARRCVEVRPVAADTSGRANGSVMRNWQPGPALRTPICPEWASTMPRAIGRPSPAPHSPNGCYRHPLAVSMAKLRYLMAADRRHGPLILPRVPPTRLTWNSLHTGQQHQLWRASRVMENVTWRPGLTGHDTQRANWPRRGQSQASSRSCFALPRPAYQPDPPEPPEPPDPPDPPEPPEPPEPPVPLGTEDVSTSPVITCHTPPTPLPAVSPGPLSPA